MKKIFLAVLLLATFILSGCDTKAAVEDVPTEPVQDVKGNLQISMLNVGHGDAILIRTSEQTILVDTGHYKERPRFISELEKLSVTKIDKLILTHPHGDHIGNAKVLINPSDKELAENPYLEKVSVAAVYDNGIASTSALYRNYMKAIAEKGIARQGLKTGDILDLGDNVKFNVIFPTAEFVATVNSGQADKKDKQYSMNNGSIVGKLTYGNFSMMFTGDCEKKSEAKILANNSTDDLKCDVLKSGHHGISTSSTKDFVAAINPSYALISAGNKEKDNMAYGQPHYQPLECYLAQGIASKNILCTRWNGTITLTSDGENFSVQPEHNDNWVGTWLARKKELREKLKEEKETEERSSDDLEQ